MLPKGWVPSEEFASPDGYDQGDILREFMQATDPDGPSVVGGPALIGPQHLPNGAWDGVGYDADPNYVDTEIGTDQSQVCGEVTRRG
ncbi:hypothetical protein KFU94_70605 [Chloroflexi bacterium TSY]|nr:hypothetical protein [Chloroflexi bacterium TSY]